MNDVKIFEDNICTLKEASKDNHAGEDVYMTSSTLPVVNFDSVKKAYAKPLSPVEMPKSVDAFYDAGGDMYLIEFKNGKVHDNEIYEVRLKIFDSLLILTDILNIRVSETRKNLNFILVYNEQKNLSEENKTDCGMQESPSRVRIAKNVHDKAGKNFIQFNFERFKTLYFKDVFTVTATEFDNRFANKWS